MVCYRAPVPGPCQGRAAPVAAMVPGNPQARVVLGAAHAIDRGSAAMRASVITASGEPEVLKLQDRPVPEPGGAEVLVRVEAAGVNRADVLQRRGMYPAPAGVPADVPGLEYAGRIEAVGPRATQGRVGDRVMGLVAGGAYAEYVIVHERETQRIPDDLDSITAAAFPETFMTAYRALFLEGGLQPGQWAVVRAATSGVGISALQLIRALGAFGIGTSRSRERLQALAPHGLAAGHVDGEGGLGDLVREHTDGKGASVCLDLVGGGQLAANLDALRDEGTLVVVGLMGGAEDRLDMGTLLRRRLTVRAMTMRSQPQEIRIRLARMAEERLVPLLSDGRLRPAVDQVFPLAEAAAAHAYMEANRHAGKIVLQVADAD